MGTYEAAAQYSDIRYTSLPVHMTVGPAAVIHASEGPNSSGRILT